MTSITWRHFSISHRVIRKYNNTWYYQFAEGVFTNLMLSFNILLESIYVDAKCDDILPDDLNTLTAQFFPPGFQSEFKQQLEHWPSSSSQQWRDRGCLSVRMLWTHSARNSPAFKYQPQPPRTSTRLMFPGIWSRTSTLLMFPVESEVDVTFWRRISTNLTLPSRLCWTQ